MRMLTMVMSIDDYISTLGDLKNIIIIRRRTMMTIIVIIDDIYNETGGDGG